MLRSILIIVLCLLISEITIGQTEFNFTGYVVDLPALQISNKDLINILGSERKQFINLTRVRLRPNLNLWEGGTFTVEYELTKFYLSTSLLFNPVSSTSTRQIVNLNWNIFNRSNLTMNHFIDRLYFRQNFDFGQLNVGRQRIAWGTGRVWNPTDLFNPIHPSNFSKIEKDGSDAASLKIIFGSFTDLNLVYNIQKGESRNNVGLRFRTNYSEYDLSIMSGYFDDRVVMGGDFAGNLFDAGIRGEGIISFDKNKSQSNFSKYILGIDYQFTAKLYGLVEYHYNGEGATQKSRYEFHRLFKGEIINVARRYFAVQSSYLIHPLVTSVVAVNSNLDDGSGFVSTLLSYSFTDDLQFGAGGQIFYGNKYDEYWFFPKAFYLRGEYYF
ncbi:MAG: hypothetical protein QME25_06505 [Bacteroidota bacterium]|nr:hypothetical protein [Bacteroidota bacterium]